MLVLLEFQATDFPFIAQWIKTPREHFQWAGPGLPYPLKEEDWDKHLELSQRKVYKAVEQSSGVVIGCIELDKIGSKEKNGIICRVLVSPEHRKKGFGESMLKALITNSQENLGIAHFELHVFTFNTSAINLYEKLGFEKLEIKPAYFTFFEEKWDLMKMKKAQL